MKKTYNKLGLKLFIALIIALFIINMAINYSKNKKKQDNIYNVMGMEETKIKYKTKAYFVFDEYTIDSFEDINVNIDEKKLLRSEEKLFDGVNSQVNNKIKKQNEFINKNSTKKNLKDKDEIIELLYDNKLSKLNFSFLDSINETDKFSKKKRDIINSYMSEDAFIVGDTGFYLTKTDGYESLINSSNIDAFNNDFFSIKNIEKDKLQTGLKYVNNKAYYILAKVENFEKYMDLGVDNLSISFDDQDFYVSDYTFSKDINDNYYLKFKMNEGIEKALNHRITDIEINFKNMNTIKIPEKAIHYKDDIQGVYCIDSGVIEFAPVKVLYREDGMCSILTNPEDVLSKSYLDLVKKNNDNLKNDRNDKDYIYISQIHEFSNILLELGSYKVGDRY